MSISVLKKKLYEDPEKIIDLLEHYKFYSVQRTSKEIRCARDREGNKTAIRIKLNENLNSEDYAKAINGDIFSIICTVKNENFFNVIQYTKKILGIVSNIEIKEKKPAFGGFFDNIKRQRSNDIQLKTYSEDILGLYSNGYNTRFLVDGISLKTQKKFTIGYCNSTNRITVPWRDFEGNLVGIMGRYNGSNDSVSKWFPVIAFSKSATLFGYSENYPQLLNSDIIYIGESEKFVLQLDTMGYNNCVALGSNNITEYQAKEIIKTLPKKIIFCYDEGLDINIILNQCLKVKRVAKLINIEVGYVYDKKNEILKLGGKDSPSDLGKENFERLVTDYVRWV